MKTKQNIPPKSANRFLSWFCKGELLEEILGDLYEYHEELMDKPNWKRRLIYWFHIFHFLRPFALKKLEGAYRLNNYGMFKHNLKIGWRTLFKNRIHSLINILGLTIGVTSCLVIFLFVKYEYSFDNSAPAYDRTYRVVQHTQFAEQILYWNTTAYPLAQALRDDLPEIETVTQAAGPVMRTFSSEHASGRKVLFEEEGVLFVGSDYPKVFGIEWLEGNPETALMEFNSVVLTESIAKKCFGSDNKSSVLGKSILLNNKDPLIVTGIIKDASGNSNLLYSMLIPYAFFKKHNVYHTSNWSGNYQGTTFLVLNNQNQQKDIEKKINTWKKKYLIPEDDSRISYLLQPIAQVHTENLYGSPPGGYVIPEKFLKTASILGIFMLLIVIANFVNLVTAQSSVRQKEVGIRKIVGSSRFELIKQFSVENTILVFLSLIISGGATKLVIDYLNGHFSIIDLRLQFGWQEILVLAIIGIVTILLAVLYPSVILSKFDPIRALKGSNASINGKGIYLRRLLTTFQFSIVQLFVFAATIVGMQLNHMRSNDLGFSSEAILSISVPDQDKSDVLKSALMQHKSVSNVAFGSGPPMAVNGFQLGTSFRLPHESMEESKKTEMKIGNPDYLDFYNLKLIAGRNFLTNKMEFDEFIANEKLVKSMNWTVEEAIGKKLRINEGEATIVGVVADFHNNSLQYEITPCVFLNWGHFLNRAFVKLDQHNSQSIAEIEEIWIKQFSGSVFNFNFLEDSIEKEYAIENLVFDGFKVFSLLVLLVGSLGLLGLMSFTVKKRTKEIGIRKVFGATYFQILSFLSKEFVLLIVIASVLVIPVVVYFMDLWLQSFVYRIEMSGWIFLISGLATLLISVMVSLIHTTKAAMANPVDSIRNE